MSSTVPASHVTDALSLEADGYVHLFKLLLYPTGIIAFTGGQGITWQGVEFEQVACKLSGLGSHASEQVSRPKLDIQNPDGAYSKVVSQGSLNGARIQRFRVLRSDALADNNIYVSNTWRIGRVTNLTRVRLSLELRELGDGPNYVVPALTFSAPEFPSVTLR